jgi:signal transduction histidine kinase
MKNNRQSIRIFDQEANIISLKFKNPVRESEFNHYYISKFLWQLRLAHVLAAVFFFVAVFAEHLFLKNAILSALIRIIIVDTSFILGLLITFYFKSFYIKYYKVFNIYYVLITSFSFILSGALAPEPYTYSLYSGIMISLIFNYTFIRQDFLKASITGLLVLAIYLYVAFSGTGSSAFVFHVSIYIAVANFLGMFIAYSIEYDARKSFLMMNQISSDAKAIVETNKNLESLVLERTAELNKAKVKAEESDRLKTAFLLNISHEIRTPLNGIIGFTELLTQPGISKDEQNSYVEKIQASGDRLTNTVTNLIEISKIQTNQIGFLASTFDAITETRNIIEDYQEKITRKNINLVVKLSDNGDELLLHTDRAKFGYILATFIKNAIKYTQQGEIEIGVKSTGENIFYVKDTGKGIPEERQEGIFRAFEQADIEDKQALQGTGIELTISHAYAKIMDCSITLKSKVGKGSTFYLKVPARE